MLRSFAPFGLPHPARRVVTRSRRIATRRCTNVVSRVDILQRGMPEWLATRLLINLVEQRSGEADTFPESGVNVCDECSPKRRNGARPPDDSGLSVSDGEIARRTRTPRPLRGQPS